jgi:anhydro-N-acetylmuramic acid kinase
MKKSLVLGIMSGTSIDSVDYALCEIGGKGIRLCQLWSARFPEALQAALHSAARGDLASHALAQLHHDLGRFYARHAQPRRETGRRPDFIGLHGQTIFHNPSPEQPATMQLGEPAWLVEKLRAPVVSNFRAADMAAGGQGAPLATIFHQRVFARRGKHICVNNLGGISNVTSLDGRKGGRGSVLAFDTGPGNVLIDIAMRHLSGGRLKMDKDGQWAARGRPATALVDRWLEHDYFAQKPPKSTGRELFGEPFFKNALRQMRRLPSFDKVATLTDFTARSLAQNYRLHLASRPDQIILTGGGAGNPTLVRAIAAQFSGGPAVEVVTSAALGWPVQSIEPAAFALLAWLRMTGQPGNLPETTGARRAALLGQVSEY